MPRWPWGSQPPEPPPPPRAGAFHITRLDEQPPIPAPRPSPLSEAPRRMFVARFGVDGHAGALTLVAAVRNESRRHPAVRRAPDRSIWVEVHAPQPTDAELTWALGGVVHLPEGTDVVSPRKRRRHWDEVHGWPEMNWVELATGIAPGAGPVEQKDVLVVTTGTLARWVVERFQSAELDLRVSTAQLTSLFRESTEKWPAVLVRVSGRGTGVPAAATQALAGLPHTVVCRLSGGRLLIDQRLVLPLADPELAHQVPADQQWLLSGDLGAWRVGTRSAEYRPPVQAGPGLLPPPAAPPGRLPAGLGLSVTMRRDDRPLSVDALLLRDDELTGLRRYLTGLPVAERAYLVLGPGLHLFADPAHGVGDIPFGVPLHRIGPGALFQEIGYRLQPAIPGPARAALFRPDGKTLVVLTAQGAHRLLLAAPVPAWSLWLGPVAPPEAAPGPLSATARQILERVDAVEARVDPAVVAQPARDQRRDDLRAEGFLLEQNGELEQAAHKYWEAGEPALAARLYELAAEGGT